ncbi:cyclopropane-fatty-acyl-phospholipid synthase [Motilibacter rhizosphaerae]|uniref:Cyclopropane-fatty-acyl-phospholipid synthase n=1 Tax=Motilibacter rhizosphaerae TaxID=598652 RepID=A0A4Q7NR75_9ACTN|nr:class I SAM-dependent methyltransferase [Motilibacter rhizosphaerae]RZS89566.1 cyclopropane-fatty-acyl-phospholipid synthase [Motilibacter rhizosphaerae]
MPTTTAPLSIARAFETLVGASPTLRWTAYDGSTAGPDDAAVTVEVRSPQAVAFIVTSPGELGMARAYVSGELEIHGDTHTALSALSNAALDGPGLKERVEVLRSFGASALKRPPLPPEEIVLSGWRRHSKQRDAEAISHHYDISNEFYEYVLGPSMAYTCAVYPERDATLEEAQANKFDLVCRKLGLQPGMKLLDVGCGWGGMVMHAAEHYGVQALGVTLSRRQAEWAQKAIADRGLAGSAEVRFSDYRDAPDAEYDRVSSIGLTEHIGDKELDDYFGRLYAKLKPGGRLLNHCITRPDTSHHAIVKKGFINRYVFPDGELVPVGRIVTAMHDAGFEVRHEENLREHYAMTLRDWGQNLEDNWEAAVAEVGWRRARVWRLYMAGSRMGFDRRSIELHQVLGVRTDSAGRADVPLRPDWGV